MDFTLIFVVLSLGHNQTWLRTNVQQKEFLHSKKVQTEDRKFILGRRTRVKRIGIFLKRDIPRYSRPDKITETFILRHKEFHT